MINNSKFKIQNLKFPIAVLFAFFLLFTVGCSTNQANNSIESKSWVSENKAKYDYYTVQPKDSISSIAKKFNTNAHDIADSNNLHAPYKLHVGQRLRIAVDKHKDLVADAKAENWMWPTKGKIVKTFFEGKSGGKGIDIAGRSGQPILASVAGRVVYSGAGLQNYGNLIIIKYNETFLAAYGFVKNSQVKEGEIVSQGEKIAEMGPNAKGQAILHFEIRENGKAVDPLLYLKVQ